MTIKVGDRIPEATLAVMQDGGPAPVKSGELFAGKLVVMFGLPGAFTPTCSAKHLPGFIEHAAALKAKGVDTIVCHAVNDVFVMAAWGKDQSVGDDVVMLADGSAELTQAMGIELDLSGRGLGLRCLRYSLIADDGVVSALNIEEGGAYEVSSAEKILEQL